ncbi:MAG: hypothetical protein DRH12_05185 [Deltaproteobacteria bacterium]|nr:MAG: hypothetical protein DRH12_05185 [Deltaproteobacteria bacterium]
MPCADLSSLKIKDVLDNSDVICQEIPVTGAGMDRQDLIMPAATLQPDEMKIHPLTLSFDGELEEKFREDYYLNSLKMVRISLLAGMLLYGLFGLLDAQLIPEMKPILWFVRFAIVWPFLLGVILFSYTSAFKKVFQPVVALTMLIAGGAIIYMIAILPPPVNQTYYAGLILVFIWGYTFTRVRFVWATPTGWLLVVLYELVATQVARAPAPVLLNNNFFFISSNLVGMLACYFIEYYARRDFFLAYQLEREQEKVKSANQRLEKIVQQRTAELVRRNQELKQEIEERKRSEKKRAELESKLQEAQKMKALGTLAGGIAHDFNNLLMGIQGNTSLMLLDTDPSHPHYEKLKNTEQYVLRGSELTRQLLGFARGGKYEVKPTALNELIEKSSQMFGRTKKEISIHYCFQDDLWTVNVDRGQIEQVLLNLFVNAWQAMPGGGHLYINTQNIEIASPPAGNDDVKPGRYVKTSVRDTGIGMDKKTMKRIFDPFFTTKEMTRGTGLGLASAYGIIKNHDGFFEVESKVGEGSTFSFYLPASDCVVVGSETEAKEELLKGQETVLVVDDEPAILDVACGMLEKLGYKVVPAGSGQEAIRLYKEAKEEVDLVLLDVIMPGMSGRETFENLKKLDPEVKVLLSSGYSLAGEASKIVAMGCCGFVQKPYDIFKLSQKVRQALNNGSGFQQWRD